jgi:hypothetical protein
MGYSGVASNRAWKAMDRGTGQTSEEGMTDLPALREAVDKYDDAAFEMFASCYPHEAYGEWPERFWAWFHREYPTVTRAEMEAAMAETDHD